MISHSSHTSSRVVGKRKNLRVHMRDREKEESPLDTMVGETECHVACFGISYSPFMCCPHSPLIVRQMDGLFALYVGIARTGSCSRWLLLLLLLTSKGGMFQEACMGLASRVPKWQLPIGALHASSLSPAATCFSRLVAINQSINTIFSS